MKKSNAKSGDVVEIDLGKKIYWGVLLESLEDEKEIVLVKLSSGYNVGVLKKEVREIKVLKKAKEVKEE